MHINVGCIGWLSSLWRASGTLFDSMFGQTSGNVQLVNDFHLLGPIHVVPGSEADALVQRQACSTHVVFFILNIGSVCIHELSWKESDFPNGCIRQSHYENDSVAFGCKECHGGNWSYSTWTSDSATHQHYPSFFRVYKYKRKWLTFVIRYPWKASYDVGHFLGYHTSPRLAGTLPLMHGLRRALDWKQLKKALERTGAVIWTSCLFPTCSGNVIYVCFELALGNKRKRAKWNWSRNQWVRMVSVGLYLGSTNSEPCISVTQCK